MPANTVSILKEMTDETLAIFALNVGDGDSIIVRFPPKFNKDNKTACGIVDCYKADKTKHVLDKLGTEVIPFVCATHPHYDHIAGLKSVIEDCIKKKRPVERFWDSGFRHVSETHYKLIQLLTSKRKIDFVKLTSGFETTFNRVRTIALSPSILLRNRYDTFGTNINNASIVLKLEYPHKDVSLYYRKTKYVSDEDLAKEERLQHNTAILGADAQLDSWARITQEFPQLERTDNRGLTIDRKKASSRPLCCQLLKVPHHMSKHGISLEVLEKIKSNYVFASCSDKSEHGFPHQLTDLAVEDCFDCVMKKQKKKGIFYTGHPEPNICSGSLVALFEGNGALPKLFKLGEGIDDMPDLTKATPLN